MSVSTFSLYSEVSLLSRASQLYSLAFNLVCVKIPLCNGACCDKSDGTVFLLFAVE